MTERQLIREIREQLVKACNCDEVREDPLNSEVCGSCILVGMIDEGLERIGQTKKKLSERSIKKLKAKSAELMRSGNMSAAVKLYNEAWDQERSKEGRR